MSTVAKKTGPKSAKPKTPPPPDRPAIAVTIRGSHEWKEWIEAGATFCRTDVAKLIDASVVDYLKARGFKTEAPPR
jgi:hypothetical protein